MPAQKQFCDYISASSNKRYSLKDYQTQPANAFLRYVVCAKDASVQCKNKFKLLNKRTYTDDATESIQIINAGLLAAIMGNFETFQKYLFAGAFEYSIYLKDFKVEEFFRKLNDAQERNGISVDLVRIAAFRDNSIPVGLILADQLHHWHNPCKVDSYFHAFDKTLSFYSNEDKKQLSILWQMRHSIVHSAGTITLPDAQKVESLNQFGGIQIALNVNFIYEVARKLHPVINGCVTRLRDKYLNRLKPGIQQNKKTEIEKFFEVKSSCSVWLR